MRAVFMPSWNICVDESMSRWTNRKTVPNWVYVPRKPTPCGQEWHALACSQTDVLFAIEPVESADVPKRFEDAFSPMPATVLRLVELAGLFHTPRVLVGDSAFPSLPLMEELLSKQVHCIFALKKRSGWTRGIPGDAVLQQLLAHCSLGESCCLPSIQTRRFRFFVAAHMDMNPVMLVSNASSMLVPRYANLETRLIRSPNGSYETKTFQRPEVMSLFYQSRHCVADSNNVRQGRAGLEDAWHTTRWEHRTFAFILALCEANAFKMLNFVRAQRGSDPISHTDFRVEICTSMLTGSADPTTVRAESAEAHTLETFPTDRFFRGGSWHRRVRRTMLTGRFQRRCAKCEIYRRVTTYCSCDPLHGLCRTCYVAHRLAIRA
eukprot:m.923276 g.923276  ORF g.923276 m.923276 type:complete len:378 (-) comp108166_c0_seq1:83-1216(-)